jgi:hypothetical protein
VSSEKQQSVSREDRFEEALYLVLLSLTALVPLVYSTVVYEPFALPKMALLFISGGVLAGLVAAGTALGRLRVPHGGLLWAALGFVAWVAVSTAFSVDWKVSLFGLRNQYFGLIPYLLFLTLAVSGWTVSWTPGRLRGLFAVNSVAGSAVAGLAVAQFLGLRFPLDLSPYFGTHAYGTFGNPNFLAGHLVVALMTSVGYRRLSGARPLLAEIAGATIFLGLLAAQSTGGLAAAVIGLATLTLFAAPEKRRLWLPATVAALVLVLSAGAWWTWRTEAANVVWRGLTWQTAATLTLERPVAGWGLGSLKYVAGRHLPVTKGFHEEVMGEAHNLWLTLGVTTGLVGAGLMAGLILMTVARLYRVATSDRTDRGVATTTLMSAIVGYVAAAMVNPEFAPSAAVWWMLLGVSGALTAGRMLPPPLMRYGGAVIMAALAVFFVALGTSLLAADLQLRKAEAAPVPTAIPIYKKAGRFFPFNSLYAARATERLFPLVGLDPTATRTALEAANEAIAVAPLDADNYVNLGEVHRLIGERTNDGQHYQQASEWFEQALEYNRHHIFAFQLLAKTADAGGRTEEASYWAKEYLKRADSAEMVGLTADGGR